MWLLHTLGDSSAWKRRKALTFSPTQMHLEDMMLTERSRHREIVCESTDGKHLEQANPEREKVG